MNASVLLSELARQGIAVRVEGEDLCLKPATVPPALLAAVRSAKPELLRILSSPPDPVPVEISIPPRFTAAEISTAAAMGEHSPDGPALPYDPPEGAAPHSWPFTEEERQSARYIEAWNARIDARSAGQTKPQEASR